MESKPLPSPPRADIDRFQPRWAVSIAASTTEQAPNAPPNYPFQCNGFFCTLVTNAPLRSHDPGLFDANTS
ncbi:hypothetical protein FSARC_6476 [Fusarium sarcochroum]|uniref:Uncharacterized protein n=1 Tax=Fusarium sarcochroum TaxID=1208366 RepID=A0A8H4X9A9_9HYPO|nr:hypothetical protein FSARC_6476 [Fusarium sarcochroum]